MNKSIKATHIKTTHMKSRLLIGGALLLLAAKPVCGAENTSYDRSARDDRADTYRSHELSLDVFGSASLGQEDFEDLTGESAEDDSELGAGLGLNYFFTRNFGFGADVYSENTTGDFVDSASASLIFRLPLGQSGFAPYAFGGGGHLFDPGDVWFAQLGAGIEFRFMRQLGAFLDARWVLPEENDNYGVARLGLRFAF